MKTTRYHKARHGGVVQITTDCEPTAKRMIRETDRPNEQGYIARMTKEEAEKDPIPKP